MGLLGVWPVAASLYHIALLCTRRCSVEFASGERVRCRFCTKDIEGTLTGGKVAVLEADHSDLVSRLRTSDVMPSLPVCVHSEYRDRFTFVFNFCVLVLLI